MRNTIKSGLEKYAGGKSCYCSRKHSTALAPLSFLKSCESVSGVSPCCEGYVVPEGGERSDTVYVHQYANREIPQPRVWECVKLCDERPTVTAEWAINRFVWLSKYLDRLPDWYLKLMVDLEKDSEDYSLEIQGFYRYYHTNDEYHNCDVEHIIVPKVRVGKYHPYYSVKHSRRASSRSLDRLEFLEKECRRRHVKFDYLIGIELTLPKQISEMWYSRKVEYCIRKAVRDFLSELHGELFNHDSQFGAIKNPQYWSSKNPFQSHRHVHLNIPNVCYNKATNTFHRFKPKIDADLIREVWLRVLRKNALWSEIPDHVKPDVYIQYIPFKKRDKIIHRLSYCSRKPVEDIVGGVGKGNCQLAVESGLYDEGFVRFLLDYTPRVVNMGFMTDLKRFCYSRKREPLKCPICGGDMLPERDERGEIKVYDRPPPDIPRLERKRGGKWERISNLEREQALTTESEPREGIIERMLENRK